MSSLRDLQSVVIVAAEGHFGRAADRLGIAQPQLSERVGRLERQAGFRIFARRPRVALTAAGEVYVRSLKRLLADAEDGLAAARAVASGKVGTVRLGFAPVSLMSGLPAVLRRFRLEHPAVTLKLTERHSRFLSAGLQRGEFDLVITREEAPAAGVESVEIARDAMVLALPADHPLAAGPDIALADLTAQDFILFGRAAAPEYHDRIMASCRAHGLEPAVVQEADGWSAILSLVSAGLGVSIVSAALSRIGFPGVAFRPLDADFADAAFRLCWRPDHLDPAAERLVAAIRTAAATAG